MMKNRKLVKGIALAAVITALAAGGTAAYLTDFETATNSFTVGKVDIDLDEPNWKPEDNTDLVPTQVIRKDPYVANKGVNEAFVYPFLYEEFFIIPIIWFIRMIITQNVIKEKQSI